MQPQQPSYPPQGNYDFIFSPQQPAKPSGFGGGSKLTRVLIVLGAAFVLIVLLTLAFRLLTGNNAPNKDALIGVAQDQAEIIRLSTTGVENSQTQAMKDFSITAQLGVRTSQKAYLEYLATGGIKPNQKTLALKQSADTDKQLETAMSASAFDIVYESVMEKSLNEYRQDLTKAYNMASNDEMKTVLKSHYDSAGLLLTQLKE